MVSLGRMSRSSLALLSILLIGTLIADTCRPHRIIESVFIPPNRFE